MYGLHEAIDHLKLFHPAHFDDPRTVAMLWGVTFATALWMPLLLVATFVSAW